MALLLRFCILCREVYRLILRVTLLARETFNANQMAWTPPRPLQGCQAVTLYLSTTTYSSRDDSRVSHDATRNFDRVLILAYCRGGAGRGALLIGACGLSACEACELRTGGQARRPCFSGTPGHTTE